MSYFNTAVALLVLLAVVSELTRVSARSRPKLSTLVLIDSEKDFISGYARKYCDDNGIFVIDVLSPRTCKCFTRFNKLVPEALRAPLRGEEEAWQQRHDSILSQSDKVFCVSESDCGISTAVRLQEQLQFNGNLVPSNRVESSQINSHFGSPFVRQRVVSNLIECEQFWNELEVSGTQGTRQCVVKKSGRVYLCSTVAECKIAFEKLSRNQAQGDRSNIIVQKYVDGQEYTVDTVTRNGETKVVALWKQHKVVANEMPFILQSSHLISAESSEAATVCLCCINFLNERNFRWGPSHTNIIFSSALNVPQVIGVNARWNHQNFVELVRSCVGYDAITTTMHAYFEADKFNLLPDVPSRLLRNGRIIHLISFKEGRIRSFNHLDTILSLPSVKLIRLHQKEGDIIVKTVDFQTHFGYIILSNEDENELEKDYQNIIELQSSMIDVISIDENSSEPYSNVAVADNTRSSSHEVMQNRANFEEIQQNGFSDIPSTQYSGAEQTRSSNAVRVEVVDLSIRQKALWTILQTWKLIAVEIVCKRLCLNTAVMFLFSHIIAQLLPYFRNFFL